MTIELCTTDARDRDAILYYAHRDQWHTRVTLKDGRRCYAIPSRSRAGLFHLTDGAACTCEDWTTRQPAGGCAHMRAAILYRMAQAAVQSKRKAPKAKRAVTVTTDRAALQIAGAEHAVTATSWSPCARGCGVLVEPMDGRVCQDCRAKGGAAYRALYGADDDKPYCTPCRRHHDVGAHYAARAS